MFKKVIFSTVFHFQVVVLLRVMPEIMGDLEELPRFEAPGIQENANGWGPCDMPEQFKDMPYQPFSKGDRLGKVSTNQIKEIKFQGKGLSKNLHHIRNHIGAHVGLLL